MGPLNFLVSQKPPPPPFQALVNERFSLCSTVPWNRLKPERGPNGFGPTSRRRVVLKLPANVPLTSSLFEDSPPMPRRRDVPCLPLPPPSPALRKMLLDKPARDQKRITRVAQYSARGLFWYYSSHQFADIPQWMWTKTPWALSCQVLLRVGRYFFFTSRLLS